MNLKHILRQIEPRRGNLRHDSRPGIVADPPLHIDAIGGGQIIRAAPIDTRRTAALQNARAVKFFED